MAKVFLVRPHSISFTVTRRLEVRAFWFQIVAALAALTRAAPTVGDGPAKIDVAGIEIKPVAELGGKFFALGGYGAGGGHGLGYGGGYSHGYNVNVYTLVVHRRQTSSTSSIQQGCYGG